MSRSRSQPSERSPCRRFSGAFRRHFCRGAAAAAGIAVINHSAILAGFVGPYAVGWIKDSTGSTDSAMYALAASLVFAAVLVRCAHR